MLRQAGACVFFSLIFAGTAMGQEATPAAVPTFARDVAPILFKSCVSCHRPGDVAPFPLRTYAEVQPWAKIIKDQVVRREMPPWLADPAVAEYANDPRLTDREIKTIADWVDGGAPGGSGRDLPAPPVFPVWQLGTPDAIVRMPAPLAIPADGPRILQQLTIATTFDEDKYVEWAEILPGRRGHTHHAMVTLADGDGVSVLGSYLPGGKVPTLPAGVVKRIPKGASITLAMHYYPSGEAASDSDTRIGFKFAKAPTGAVALTGLSGSRDIDLAPNVPEYEVRGAPFVFSEDSHIISFMPRMYQRGKNFLYRLTLPDGTSRDVMKTTRWEDDWQPGYLLKTPVAAPKGSRLQAIARFDNTAGNENNPDPKVRVRYPQEVVEGYFEYTRDAHQARQ